MVDEALDFYVKATVRDGTQKRKELVNMRPGELRRSLERWQVRAEEVQRFQDKKEQAWDLYRRVLSKRREDFENEFHRWVTRNDKADEKLLQDWTDELQAKVRVIERRSEARETKQMGIEDFSSQQRRTWEKLEEIVAFSVSATALKSS